MSATIQRAWIGVSGQTLTIDFDSGSGAAGPVVTAVPGSMPTVTFDSTALTASSYVYIIEAEEDPGQFNQRSNIHYNLPSVIPPGKTVTLSIAANAITTANGGNAAATGMSVTNHSGGSLLPTVAKVGRTMQVGINSDDLHENINAPVAIFANRLKGAQGFYSAGDNWGIGNSGFDANGLPNDHVNDYTAPLISIWDLSLLGGSKSYVVAEAGLWTVLWEGAGSCILQGSVRLDSEDRSQTIKKRTYTVTNASGSNCPQINFVCGGVVSNPQVYDASIPDPYNPPLFHPKVVAQYSALSPQCYRDMRQFEAIGAGCAKTADYPPESAAIYGGWFDTATSFIPIGTASLQDYAVGQKWHRTVDNNYRLKITCATPHGLRNGDWLTFRFGSPTTHLFTLFDGSTATLPLTGYAFPLDSTSFVLFTFAGVRFSATPQAFPTGTIAYRLQGMTPLAIPMKFSNAIGCTSYWHCFNGSSSNQHASDYGTLAAATLNAGVKLLIEYGNEIWLSNWGVFSFDRVMAEEFAVTRAALTPPDNSWTARGSEASLDYAVMRGRQLFDLAKAAWVAAGRSAGDIKYVVNCQWGYPDRSSNQMLAAAQDHDADGKRVGELGYAGPIVIDKLAGAPYAGLYPAYGTTFDATIDAMTLAQRLDYSDAFLYTMGRTGSFAHNRDANLAYASTHYPDAEWVYYECGIQGNGMIGPDPNWFRATIAAPMHPRARNQYLAYMAAMDDAGATLACIYRVADCVLQEGGTGGKLLWRAYLIYCGQDQVAGMGDGSDGKHNNLASLADGTTGLPHAFELTGMVAPIAQAVGEWNGSLTPVPTFTVSPTTIATGSTGNVLSLVGSSTLWDGSTTFSVSGGSGASVTGHTVASHTSAALIVTAGSSPGTLTIHDSDDAATASVTAATMPVASMTANVASVEAGSVLNAITLTGVNTAWDGSTTFSVSGGTGSAITSHSVASTTSAIIELTAGSATGTLTIHDSDDAATTTLTVEPGGGGPPVSYTQYCTVNFGPGKASLATVGYTLTGGSRITAGVAEIGTATGIYGATVTFSDAFSGRILWDTGGGSPVYAVASVNPLSSGQIALGSVTGVATGIFERLAMLWYRLIGGTVTAPKDGNGAVLVKSGVTTLSTQTCTDDGTTQTLNTAT